MDLCARQISINIMIRREMGATCLNSHSHLAFARLAWLSVLCFDTSSVTSCSKVSAHSSLVGRDVWVASERSRRPFLPTNRTPLLDFSTMVLTIIESSSFFERKELVAAYGNGVRSETQVHAILRIVVDVHIVAEIDFRIFDVVLVVFRVVNNSSFSSDRTFCAYGPLSSKFAWLVKSGRGYFCIGFKSGL